MTGCSSQQHLQEELDLQSMQEFLALVEIVDDLDLGKVILKKGVKEPQKIWWRISFHLREVLR